MQVKPQTKRLLLAAACIVLSVSFFAQHHMLSTVTAVLFLIAALISFARGLSRPRS